MGDIHGQLDKVRAQLQRCEIIDSSDNWTAGTATLCFVGDYVNRGPGGLDVLRLIRRLDEQSKHVGGHLIALLGNHDVRQLSAWRFREDPEFGPKYLASWINNGGTEEDIHGLGEFAHWFAALPACASVGESILIHADSDFYLEYGETTDEINRSVKSVIDGVDVEAWEALQSRFNNRHDFDLSRPGGYERACHILDLLGGTRLIHGHTPIDKITRQEPESVVRPLLYAEGLCLNVDGGMYRGGPGFLLRLDAI